MRKCIIEDFSIKKMYYKGNGSHLFSVTLCCKNVLEGVLLVRVGKPSLEKEWKIFLVRQAFELFFVDFLYLDSLWLKGTRGKKSTPRVSWQVPMKFRWLGRIYETYKIIVATKTYCISGSKPKKNYLTTEFYYLAPN